MQLPGFKSKVGSVAALSIFSLLVCRPQGLTDIHFTVYYRFYNLVQLLRLMGPSETSLTVKRASVVLGDNNVQAVGSGYTVNTWKYTDSPCVQVTLCKYRKFVHELGKKEES